MTLFILYVVMAQWAKLAESEPCNKDTQWESLAGGSSTGTVLRHDRKWASLADDASDALAKVNPTWQRLAEDCGPPRGGTHLNDEAADDAAAVSSVLGHSEPQAANLVSSSNTGLPLVRRFKNAEQLKNRILHVDSGRASKGIQDKQTIVPTSSDRGSNAQTESEPERSNLIVYIQGD